MLSIGEFSKICKVSTKTLRYYAEIRLINPDTINPENGYRYYSIEQLKKMLFIDRLKSYSFSLDEIKAIFQMDKDQSEEKLSLALTQKKKDMQVKISALERTLSQLTHDIASLNQGIPMMSNLDTIDLQLVEPQPIYLLSIRKTVSVDDCSGGYGRFFHLLYEKIAAANLTMTGPPMTLYHSTEYNPAGYDIEFAIPVKEFVSGTREFTPGLCLMTELKGSYSNLTSIYARQREWMENENYESTSSPYDIYVTDPEQVSSPEEFITQVYCPIKKNLQ